MISFVAPLFDKIYIKYNFMSHAKYFVRALCISQKQQHEFNIPLVAGLVLMRSQSQIYKFFFKGLHVLVLACAIHIKKEFFSVY